MTDVPAGLTQLGVDVQLLAGEDLAAADLRRFDAIMTGTRAYAVREDLKTYNRRLLDYVKGGGNLIVLYNTQELVPNQYAPFPGELSRDAEEVSEEDSPVEILAPSDPVFNTPNKMSCSSSGGHEGDINWAGSQAIITATSNHPGGVNVCMGDGSVKVVKDSVAGSTWWALGTRNGEEVISSDSY